MMFVFDEIGQAIGPKYSVQEAFASVVSETIYLPLSASMTHGLVGTSWQDALAASAARLRGGRGGHQRGEPARRLSRRAVMRDAKCQRPSSMENKETRLTPSSGVDRSPRRLRKRPTSICTAQSGESA